MTKRTPYGYAHPNAYREWLPEHDDLLRAVALKARSGTALQSTVPLETLSVVLGRSPMSIARRAQKLELALLDEAGLQEIAEQIKLEESTGRLVDDPAMSDDQLDWLRDIEPEGRG